MRREASKLLTKACDSLILGIELYNRPNNRGRVSGTLIFLNHAFEMLLKAAIVHRGGDIQERKSGETINFGDCIRRGTSDGQIKFLTEPQTVLLRAINNLRNAVQHYFVDVSENLLYLHIQSGVTVFRDLLKSVFQKDLVHELPERVLPISTSPPADISTIFDAEIQEILRLLRPGRRRRIDAAARLRTLALIDSGIQGEEKQPTKKDLTRLSRELANRPWDDVFKGVASVQLTTDGAGPSIAIRLTKKEGPSVQIMPQNTPGALPLAIKRVNELDFYNLSATALADRVGLTIPKLVAVVAYAEIRQDLDCYKEFPFGKSLHKRYSQKAIGKVQDVLKTKHIDDIWEWHIQSRSLH